jgi:hypothetical protein
MQFQNRKDSNVAGRGGRMDDFAPDPSDFSSSRGNNGPSPNDAYAKGGYEQDSRDGSWKDGNTDYDERQQGRGQGQGRGGQDSGFGPSSSSSQQSPSYSQDTRFGNQYGGEGQGPPGRGEGPVASVVRGGQGTGSGSRAAAGGFSYGRENRAPVRGTM